jgi:xylobiose transport system permease protein
VTSLVADRGGRPGPLWVMPALVFFGLFALLPMVLVAYLSLTSWDAVKTPEFVGLDNWSRAFGDGAIANSLKLSLILTALCWAIQTPIALLLGVWAAGTQRSRALVTAVYFVPLLLSSAAIALVWQALLDANFGVVQSIGSWLGIENTDVLGMSRTAIVAVAVVISWQFVPLHMLLYQAGARQIPRVLYDAATVDGATRWQQLTKITIPQLRNTIVSSSVLIVVGSLTYFETVLILTGGGPGTSTAILPFRMYNEGFQAYQMGYASAIAVGLVLIGTGLSLLLVRLSGFTKMRSTLEGL